MKKRKNKTWVIVLLVILLLGMAGGAYYLISDANAKAEAATLLAEEKENYIKENTRLLYVTIDEIHKGDILVDGVNVELEECLTALPTEMYLTEEQLGNVAVVDIEAYTPVFTNMVTPEKITKDMREVEVGIAQLPLNIDSNSYVDLRIRFATGHDYIVASKLRVRDFDLENSIFYTDLNESQILTVASATVDAYTNTGTKIYLTTYEEANLQEEAVANYPVKEEVYNLILKDPNILKVAEETLNREARQTLRAYLGLTNEDYLKAVADGDGLADTAHNSAMAAKQNAIAAEATEEVTEGE